MKDDKRKTPEANRDPITGAPGSHPVGTGLGAAAGGMAAGAAADGCARRNGESKAGRDQAGVAWPSNRNGVRTLL